MTVILTSTVKYCVSYQQLSALARPLSLRLSVCLNGSRKLGTLGTDVLLTSLALSFSPLLVHLSLGMFPNLVEAQRQTRACTHSHTQNSVN